ncbi:DUF3597 domain-containing protein [Altererythrobacter sp. MTPC7]|uniref:DUF3597 domain-containing protein n=1 Tax=Altererythrobacter sp. MTPC7 TaxID=3056567 RepID=UPI0036F2C515
MGIFSSIKNAIFGDDDKKAETAPTTPTTAPPRPAATPSTPAQTSARVDVVNVENRLDSMPGADRLNWRTSIVDLLKLIGVDPSYENRKALATELGREDYSGSAEDNIWLHRKTMQELSRNGGKVPAEFLD